MKKKWSALADDFRTFVFAALEVPLGKVYRRKASNDRCLGLLWSGGVNLKHFDRIAG